MKYLTHSLLATRGALLGLGGSLAALVLWGASACSSTPPTRAELMLAGLDRLEAAMQAEIADPEARASALAALAEFRTAELAFLDSIKRSKERLVALNADHGAPRESFQSEIDSLRRLRTEFTDEVVEIHTALRELVTREEYLALMAELRREEDRWKEMAR